jgi:hypothetical protein
MQFISYGLSPAALQPEDDIDKLFTRLPQIEPPGELIARILSHVQQLREQSICPQPAPSEWDNEALVVRNELREPS